MLLTALALVSASASLGDTATAALPMVVVPRLRRVVGSQSTRRRSQCFAAPRTPSHPPASGQQRWSLPMPRAPWQLATINATAFGSSCIQKNKRQPMWTMGRL